MLWSSAATHGAIQNANSKHLIIQVVFVGFNTQKVDWNQFTIFAETGKIDMISKDGSIELHHLDRFKTK
jgi:hypothetical protein